MHPSPVLQHPVPAASHTATPDSNEPNDIPHHDAHRDLLLADRPPSGASRKGKGREKRADRVDDTRRKTWDLAGDQDDSSSEAEGDDGALKRGPVIQDSLLLNLPIESLHEILSYLPPTALLLLRAVSRDLLAAVDDEAVWRACFSRNFISGLAGAVARSSLPGGGGNSWRREALGRERLLDRMSRSKTPSITYDPRLANLTSMSLFYPLPPPNTLPHQLRPPSLLSASLLHGLAARSDVTNGKVSKGYLDPWGTTDHTSLWAPPAHASPPTVLAFANERESPTICWGFAEGSVGCTLVTGYATGNGKTSAKTFHSLVGEGHDGPVVSLVGSKDGSLVLSGGADGRVILWRIPPLSAGTRQSNLRRVWSGIATREERRREIVRRVCMNERAGGTIAAVTDDGFVSVWNGVLGSEDHPVSLARATFSDDEIQATATAGRDPSITLALDVEDPVPALANSSAKTATTIRVLLHAAPSHVLKQVTFTFPSPGDVPQVSVKPFAPARADAAELTCFHAEFAVPPPLGLPFQHSTSLVPTPSLSRRPSSDAVLAEAGHAEGSNQVLHLPMSMSIERRALGSVAQGKFLITGDAEGVVRLWNWDDGRLVREWRAMDGKITALESTMGLVLVGSLEGVLKVYDPLAARSPLLLRTFNDRSATRHLRPHLAAGALDPALWRVSHIILERDMLVACVGNKILSWRMGSGGREREGRSEWKGKVVNKKAGTSGWAGMRTPNNKGGPSPHELKSEISTARDEHREAQESLRSSLAREQAMKAKVLGGLELTDEEQMAYVLMLSQEEEEARQKSNLADGGSSEASGSASRSQVVEDGEDDMDESLREALERSLLDQSFNPEQEEFEMLFDEDEDPHPSSSSRQSYPGLPSRASFSRSDDVELSRRSSFVPTPVHGSFDDHSDWPAMLSSTPPAAASLFGVSKGKQVASYGAPANPIPSASTPSYSSVARSPPSTSACLSPSLLAQVSPPLRPVGSPSVGARTMTRAEREEEEFRLVLEMSLNDQ